MIDEDLAPEAQHEGKLTRSKSYLRLRPNLQEGRDFALVPAEVWKALVAWYGGGPALPRRVASLDDFHDTEHDNGNGSGNHRTSSPIVSQKCIVLLYPEKGTPKNQAQKAAEAAKAQFTEGTSSSSSVANGKEDEDVYEDEGETKDEDDSSMQSSYNLEPKPDWLVAAASAVALAQDTDSVGGKK